MYYIKKRRERLAREGESRTGLTGKAGKAGKTGARGPRFTFFSFIAIALFLVLSKAVNPGMSLRPMLIPFGCVFFACLVMIFFAGRGR